MDGRVGSITQSQSRTGSNQLSLRGLSDDLVTLQNAFFEHLLATPDSFQTSAERPRLPDEPEAYQPDEEPIREGDSREQTDVQQTGESQEHEQTSPASGQFASAPASPGTEQDFLNGSSEEVENKSADDIQLQAEEADAAENSGSRETSLANQQISETDRVDAPTQKSPRDSQERSTEAEHGKFPASPPTQSEASPGDDSGGSRQAAVQTNEGESPTDGEQLEVDNTDLRRGRSTKEVNDGSELPPDEGSTNLRRESEVSRPITDGNSQEAETSDQRLTEESQASEPENGRAPDDRRRGQKWFERDYAVQPGSLTEELARQSPIASELQALRAAAGNGLGNGGDGGLAASNSSAFAASTGPGQGPTEQVDVSPGMNADQSRPAVDMSAFNARAIDATRQSSASQLNQVGASSGRISASGASGGGQGEAVAAGRSSGTSPTQSVQPASPTAGGSQGGSSAAGESSGQGTSNASGGSQESRGSNGLSQQERVRLIQRVSRSFSRLGPTGGQIQLRLHPPQLGTLNVRVRLEGRDMTARLSTETAAARDAIMESLPVLRQRLSDQGFNIQQFQVEVADNRADAAGGQAMPDNASGGGGSANHDSTSQANLRRYLRSDEPKSVAEGTRGQPDTARLSSSAASLLIDRSIDLQV